MEAARSKTENAGSTPQLVFLGAGPERLIGDGQSGSRCRRCSVAVSGRLRQAEALFVLTDELDVRARFEAAFDFAGVDGGLQRALDVADQA